MTDTLAARGVAFDLDGTLVDSAPGLADAVDMALRDVNLPAAGIERISTWIGNGADIMVERAVRWAEGDMSPEFLQKVRDKFDHYYADTAASGSRLYPQVKETLAALAALGLPLGLVTNKPTPFIAPLLESLGIGSYFTLVLGGDDVVAKKPHPAPLYLMLGTLGLRASELVFVGDSRNDIQAAQAAGCPCVGMTYGYNYGETIALSKPDRVLEHFADLLPALGLSSLKDQEA
ncbi:phosphoglycolate phosphatase [Hafnia psychrotolerans]|jgi:phosphoglycolate phosphatase|uniref:Phosphoglycolate phosphatase n=1 Tax=Hafnia psychrotolerans TaxID=1477018 RepID=A0ABQ1GVQ9_9GAMM|nr:phosphoglycolate phosphatase [Hafnia psychrotolerans]GGA51346.1 phosphoglycolate phosphatase [Hafnia psychrotolerans]